MGRFAELALAVPALIMESAGMSLDPWQAEVLCTRPRQLFLNCSRQTGNAGSSRSRAPAASAPESISLRSTLMWRSRRGRIVRARKAILDGDGRTFDEIAQERRKEAALNRSLAPGDPRRESGPAGIVPNPGRLVGVVRVRASRRLATVAPRLAHVRSRGDGLACWPRRP
jgi:hypothetical protein